MPEYQIGVYGASDDLIEITGDVRGEFYANFYDSTFIVVGDTELAVEYDGEWHFEVIDEGENDKVDLYSLDDKSLAQSPDYSESVVIKSNSKEVKKIEGNND